jgi:hypothetical protein
MCPKGHRDKLLFVSPLRLVTTYSMSPDPPPGMGLAREEGLWASALTRQRHVPCRWRDAYGRGQDADAAQCEAAQPTTSTESSVIVAPWKHPLASPMILVLLHGVLLLRG